MNRSFTQRKTPQKQKRRERETFECPDCGKTFRKEQSLTDHGRDCPAQREAVEVASV